MKTIFIEINRNIYSTNKLMYIIGVLLQTHTEFIHTINNQKPGNLPPQNENVKATFVVVIK